MPWVRLKPLNKSRGIVKERYSVGGKCFHGGTGNPGDIPVWYRVNAKQAAFLGTKHQKNGDPYSPKAFDIVETTAEKDAINAGDEYQRLAGMGIARRPEMSMSTAREETLLNKTTGRVDLAGMADDDGNDNAAPEVLGRAAALSGLEEPAPPVDEAPEEGTHEEMNDEDGARDVMSSADALAEMNEEVRSEVPDMTTTETDGKEPPAKPTAAQRKAAKVAKAKAAKAAKARQPAQTGLPMAVPPPKK